MKSVPPDPTPRDKATEFVHFRVFAMPCCGIHICWVNSRLPSYCPECGTAVYSRLKFHAEDHLLLNDENARLIHKR